MLCVWTYAEVVKRSNTTDCKSVGIRLRRFESCPLYQVKKATSWSFLLALKNGTIKRMLSDSSVDFKDFFHSLPNPYIIVKADDSLTIVDHNEAHASISFKKRSETLGKPLLAVYPDTSEKYRKTGVSDLEESFKKVKRTRKPDTMPNLRYDLHDESGQLVDKWWRVTHYPLFDDKGEVLYIYQVTVDITAEIVSKRELKRSNLMLKSALGIGLVGTWSWDIAHNVVKGDATLAKLFGVTANEALSGLPLETFTGSIHQQDFNSVMRAIKESVRHNKTFEHEYRTVLVSGKENWVIARGEMEFDEAKKPIALSGILVDITDRKKTESELKEIQRRYNTLFNSSVVAIAMADTSGRILQANDTCLKMFGYTREDLKKGVTSKDVSFAGGVVSNKKIYDTIKKKRELNPIRKEYVRKDGSRFSGLIGAAMLEGSDDTFIAIILDVTENEKLKEINQLKDEFIAIASHQLRTPVSTVKQYLGVLLSGYAGDLTEQQSKYISIADAANEREISIIEDLLKTTYLDTKGHELQLTPTDFIALTREVAGRYMPVVEAKKQRLELLIDDESIPHINGNAPELRTCIENLIENASKYSDEGAAIQVTVDSDQGFVTLKVRDEGVGISEKDQKRIFSKFTRINNRLSSTVTGSGLGLYWVKRIAELHGGECTVVSKVGKGTTFTIRLPI